LRQTFVANGFPFETVWDMITALEKRVLSGEPEHGYTSAEAEYGENYSIAKSDNAAQVEWMEKEAKARGFSSVSDLAMKSPKQFSSMAKQWRVRHRRIDKSAEIRNDSDSEIIDKKLFGAAPNESRGSSEDASDSADAFLRGMVGTSEAQQGSGSGKAELVEWAKANGRLISKLPFRLDGPKDMGEGEHHVFKDDKSSRIVKITKGNGDKFGNTLDLRGKNWGIGRATGLQYLERNRLSNETYGDDIRLHAVFQDKMGNVNLVISQPDVRGKSPGAGDVETAMVLARFIPLGNSSYYRAADNLLVLDLHDENANEIDGEIVVFDASLLNPTNEQLKELRKQGAPIPESPDSRAPGEPNYSVGKGRVNEVTQALQDRLRRSPEERLRRKLRVMDILKEVD
jgi:hypothetical protein